MKINVTLFYTIKMMLETLESRNLSRSRMVNGDFCDSDERSLESTNPYCPVAIKIQQVVDRIIPFSDL